MHMVLDKHTATRQIHMRVSINRFKPWFTDHIFVLWLFYKLHHRITQGLHLNTLTILVVLTPFLFVYSSNVHWIHIGRNPGSRKYAKEATSLPPILGSKGNWLVFSIRDSTIILVTIEIWMEGVVRSLHSRTITLVGPILHMVFVGRLWGRMVLVILYWSRGFYSADICYLFCLGRHSARTAR